MPNDQKDTHNKSKKQPDLPQIDVPTAASVSADDGHVKVEARPGESAEQLLRRFNREVHRAGVMKRLRELEFYEKPSKKKQREEKMREQIVRKYSE